MHFCDLHADCKNTIGTYKCQCHTGYAGSGMESDCHNIDECKLGTDDCNKKGHDSSYCVDNDGSFECYCKKGYQNNDEDLCENKNECLIGEHICDHNADCIDLYGEYRCECHEGYAGDGFNCLNIDECINRISVCPPNSECVDTIASYECACATGYEGE